jgi:hypothetical protein
MMIPSQMFRHAIARCGYRFTQWGTGAVITRWWVYREKYVLHIWHVRSVPSTVQILFLSARSVEILSSVILCDISSLLFSAVIYLIKLHILLTVLNDSYYLTSYWRNYSNLHHIICITMVAAMLSASRHRRRRRSKEQDYLRLRPPVHILCSLTTIIVHFLSS